MPAITDNPTQSRLPGKVIWHDLLTDKPEQSKQFYQTLFGWQYEDSAIVIGESGQKKIPYTLIRHKGKLIGGLVDQTKLRAKVDISQWMVLLSVKDIDAKVAEVESSGGRVFSSSTHIQGRGDIAVVADNTGAMLAILESSSGDPEDVNDSPVSGFLWHELWTTDVDKALGFYKALAPYSSDAKQLADQTYHVLRAQDQPRVGLMKNPIDGLDSVWVTYIRMKDEQHLTEVLSQVENLGGRILLDAQDRNLGGKVALIAGPSGAGIALQTWPELDEEK